MKTISLNQIENFLAGKSFVLFGVSKIKGKMENSIFRELTNNGYKVFPIHKELESIDNTRCYKELSELPEKVDSAIICTKEVHTFGILPELKDFGINNVWIQQGAASPEIIKKAKENFSNAIFGKCILMFANQTGVHKFHSRLLKIFGKYPKIVSEI